MQACDAAYGDVFTVRLFGAPPFVFCSHPAAIREIFTADPEMLLAGRGNEVLRPIFGSNSVLLLDGARHRRERKLLMPPFHGDRMRLYGDIMREIVDRSIDGWPVEQVFPIHRYMQQITLDIILRTVFGVDEGDGLPRLRALLVEFLRLIGSSPVLLVRRLQVDLGPLTAWKRICQLRGEIDHLLYDEIARCRKEASESRTDIMAMLVAARDEDGQPMSDEEIRDELITMLVAGHETTATSLSWVVHRLLQNPEVLVRAQAELEAVVGNGPSSAGPTAEQIAELSYLDAVIKETARLNPIIPTVARYLEAPARIGDHELPAGCVVSPCVYLTHRRPDVWPEPEAFRPDRFVDRARGPLHLLPVRRRPASLPGRSVRRLRDENRSGSDVVTRGSEAGPPPHRPRGAAQHYVCPFRRPACDTCGRRLVTDGIKAFPSMGRQPSSVGRIGEPIGDSQLYGAVSGDQAISPAVSNRIVAPPKEARLVQNRNHCSPFRKTGFSN